MSLPEPRLQRIADLRRRESDRAAAALVAARKGVQAAQGQLDELQRYVHEYGARPLAQQVWQIQTRRAFAEKLIDAGQQQQQRIARAERQFLKAQQAFQQAQQASQSLHRAADQQRQQQQQAHDRRQQLIDDDRGLGRVLSWVTGG